MLINILAGIGTVIVVWFITISLIHLFKFLRDLYIFKRYIEPSWKREHEIQSNPHTSDEEKETQWKEWTILNNKQLSDDEKRELWALWIKNKKPLNKE